jgi:SET domain-containing protein
MAAWLNPKVEVRWSRIHGNGLFAREPLGAGEQLSRRDDDQYTVMTDAEFRAYIATVNSWDAVALGHGLHQVSLVAREDDAANYCNHSCSPNAETNHVGLVASRDIAEDEEITADYARLSAASWSMPCNCGADACTGMVRGTV